MCPSHAQDLLWHVINGRSHMLSYRITVVPPIYISFDENFYLLWNLPLDLLILFLCIIVLTSIRSIFSAIHVYSWCYNRTHICVYIYIHYITVTCHYWKTRAWPEVVLFFNKKKIYIYATLARDQLSTVATISEKKPCIIVCNTPLMRFSIPQGWPYKRRTTVLETGENIPLQIR